MLLERFSCSAGIGKERSSGVIPVDRGLSGIDHADQTAICLAHGPARNATGSAQYRAAYPSNSASVATLQNLTGGCLAFLLTLPPRTLYPPSSEQKRGSSVPHRQKRLSPPNTCHKQDSLPPSPPRTRKNLISPLPGIGRFSFSHLREKAEVSSLRSTKDTLSC